MTARTTLVCAFAIGLAACSSAAGDPAAGENGPSANPGGGSSGAGGNSPSTTAPPAPPPSTTPPPPACSLSTQLRDLAAKPLGSTDPIYRQSWTNGSLQKSVDGGKTFTAIDAGEPGNVALRGYASDAKMVVAVRALGTKTPSGHDQFAIRKSSDGGATWSPAGSFATGMYMGVALGPSGEIYALTSNTPTANVVTVHSVDPAGGEYEAGITSPDSSTLTSYGLGLHVTSSGIVVAAIHTWHSSGTTITSEDASYVKSADKGKTWSQLTKVSVTPPSSIDATTVTSDAADQIYASYIVTTKSGTTPSSKLVVKKGSAASTTFTDFYSYQVPPGLDFYVGWTTASVAKDGSLRISFLEYPLDGAQGQTTWIKSVVHTVAAGGIATGVDVTRPAADYTYITGQYFTPGGNLVLEGYGYTKTTNTVTETFSLAYACE